MAEIDEEKTQSQIYMEKLETLYLQNKELGGQNESLRTKVHELEGKHKLFTEELGKLREQNSSLEQQNKSLELQNHDLSEQKTALDSQVNSLEDANRQLIVSMERMEIQKQRKRKLFFFLRIVLFLLLAGGFAFCCYGMVSYKEDYEREQERRIQVKAELLQAQGELEQAQGELQWKQKMLLETSEELEKYAIIKNTFGRDEQSSFRAKEGVIVMHVGDTKKITVDNGVYHFITVEESDADAITAIWNVRESNVEITAHTAGHYIVKVSGKRIILGRSLEDELFKGEFDILVIVSDIALDE